MTLESHDITVLIPTKNRKELVLGAIGSVRTQTKPPKEILIIDDGSTDGTDQAIKALIPHKVPIRIVVGPGQGVGPARNRGLNDCQTKVVCFLDSDDELAPDALAVALTEWKENDTMLIFSAIQFPGNPRVLTKRTPGDQFLIEGLLGDDSDFNPPWGLARVDHLQTIGAFTNEIPCAVDYDLLLRLCANNRVVRCLKKPVYRYRRDPSHVTVSSDQVRNYRARLAALDRLCMAQPNVLKLHQRRFAKIRNRFVLRLCAAQYEPPRDLSISEKAELKALALAALKLQPWRVRVLANYLRCLLTS